MIDAVILLLPALFIANLVAFSLFAVDKMRAKVGGRRIPERTLLFAALFGGLGAGLGQHLLRHKTRKQPFATRLGLITSFYAPVLLAAATLLAWRSLTT
jgi:uncharacterized membrane protein YsdA (DUF1294 family)